MSSFCQRFLEGWRGPENNAVNAVNHDSARWSDPLTRVPDYFAGTLSAFDLSKNVLAASSKKYLQVLTHAIADNPGVSVIRLDLSLESIVPSYVKISRAPS